MIPRAKAPALFTVLACLALASRVPSGLGFGVIGRTKRVLAGTMIRTDQDLFFSSPRVAPGRIIGGASRGISMEAKTDPDGDTKIATTTTKTSGSTNENDPTVADNFDGKGFAGYLLPYALALIGSIVATGAVFKFVLLDY